MVQKLGDYFLLEAEEKIKAATSTVALEEIKASYLGPNGTLRKMMQSMPALPKEERPEFGKEINALKNEIELLLTKKLQFFADTALFQKFGERPDVTLTGRRIEGKLHPLTAIRERLETIFSQMGFVIADGPEIETEWFCFDALNTPESHPARDVMDTFFLPDRVEGVTTTKHDQERYLLRSHTSTVQIRTMLKEKPPIRIVAPGRTFRRDTIDATHSANFHQIEALYVDEQVTICDLKATLDYLLKALFGSETQTRLRPSFFPFTEPSFEVDFRAPNLGKLSDQWIEILGCGMVDPEVFKAVGIDSRKWTGFAAGLGLERLAMLLYGIDDVRMFYQNDLRFLDQF